MSWGGELGLAVSWGGRAGPGPGQPPAPREPRVPGTCHAGEKSNLTPGAGGVGDVTGSSDVWPALGAAIGHAPGAPAAAAAAALPRQPRALDYSTGHRALPAQGRARQLLTALSEGVLAEPSAVSALFHCWSAGGCRPAPRW